MNHKGGDGGSGIVVVRYKGTSVGTGGNVTTGTGTAAGYTVHTFTNTGSSALDLSALNLNQRLGATENGTISGTGNLTFTGPGKLTLNGTNTYSGATLINAGTLAIGSSGSIASSSSIKIASGAKLDVTGRGNNFSIASGQSLAGGGTISGNVTINGIHTPGFSPGIQTFDSNLTYGSGSSVVWELIGNTLDGRGTNYDGIDVAGDLNFSGPTTISLDFSLTGSSVDWTSSFWEGSRLGTAGWKIFSAGGDITGFTNLSLDSLLLDGAERSLASVRQNASFFLYEGTDGVYLNYNAIPEPSTTLFAVLTSGSLLLRRRRK